MEPGRFIRPRRRTVGVPVLARPRRAVVELHVRRRSFLAQAVLFVVCVGFLWLFLQEFAQAFAGWWVQ